MQIITFLYHEINNNPSDFHKNNNLFINEENFYNQISEIKNKFNIINPLKLGDKNTPNKKNALITFDDSSKGIFKYGLPILEKLKVPAIIFLNMDIIEHNNNLMTKVFFIKDMDYKNKNTIKNIRKLNFINTEEYFKNNKNDEYNKYQGEWANKNDLKKIESSNLFFIGNHSYNHYSFKNLNTNEIKNQYLKNYLLLKKYKNFVPFFSYPFGQWKLDYDNKINKIIENLGVKFIFSANLFDLKIKNKMIHRIPMFNNIKPYQIERHIKKELFKNKIKYYFRLFNYQ